MLKKIFYTLSILILFSTYIIYKQYSQYGYDTTKSYTYHFKDSKAKIYKTDIIKGKIVLKNLNLQNKTVFLEVDINSSLIGKLIQPSINISSNKKDIVSYFELGAKGKRYINISSILKKDTDFITLKPNFLTFKKDIKLITYKNPNLKDKKILIIAPHPDDAEIASFGLYSKYHKNCYIVTITAGDSGTNNYKNIYKDDTKSSYFEKAKLRVINSFTTPYIGGVDIKNSLNLGYFDATLKKMFDNKNKTIKSIETNLTTTTKYRSYNYSPLIKELKTSKNNWHSLVSDLTYLLTKISPDIIITPHPKLDIHSDHVYSTVAVFEALQKTNLKNTKLFLYTNHNVTSEIYPFGKAFSTVNLPPVFQKLSFDSIYSYNLTKKEQLEKILALESMNDLRLSTQWSEISGALWIALRNIKHKLIGNDESYFRRAVRENEIFFIYTQPSLKDTFE